MTSIVDEKKSWFEVPLLDTKDFFLDDQTRIAYGPTATLCQSRVDNQIVPDLAAKDATGEYVEKSLRSLIENLQKVNKEISGEYQR